MAEATKVGIMVKCAVCGHQKKPRGRSGPLGAIFCEAPSPFDDGCEGYGQPPRVGDLWPGETDADFGYPCSDAGTEPVHRCATCNGSGYPDGQDPENVLECSDCKGKGYV